MTSGNLTQPPAPFKRDFAVRTRRRDTPSRPEPGFAVSHE
jgi:hypothetical protein